MELWASGAEAAGEGDGRERGEKTGKTVKEDAITLKVKRNHREVFVGV